MKSKLIGISLIFVSFSQSTSNNGASNTNAPVAAIKNFLSDLLTHFTQKNKTNVNVNIKLSHHNNTANSANNIKIKKGTYTTTDLKSLNKLNKGKNPPTDNKPTNQNKPKETKCDPNNKNGVGDAKCNYNAKKGSSDKKPNNNSTNINKISNVKKSIKSVKPSTDTNNPSNSNNVSNIKGSNTKPNEVKSTNIKSDNGNNNFSGKQTDSGNNNSNGKQADSGNNNSNKPEDKNSNLDSYQDSYGNKNSNKPEDKNSNSNKDTKSTGMDIEKMLSLVNEERKKAGVSTLTISENLNQAAKIQSDYQSSTKQMRHDGPNGNSVSDRVTSTKYDFKKVAENVAFRQPTVEAVMKTWMKSPGHKKNLLNPEVKELGAAVKDGYWTQVFAAKS